jgi:hypothetical protein
MLRQAKKKPAAAAEAPQGPVVPAQIPAQYQPQPLPAQHAPAPHPPAHKPTWAAGSNPGTAGDGGNDQTMQIALGGLGGRKE